MTAGIAGTGVDAPTETALHHYGHEKQSLAKLALGAVGVVYGDIGTSPLYAVKESFVGHHKLVVDQLHVLGVISLMFWSLMLIVTLKYISIILRADNNGEGGSLALLALIQRRSRAGKRWGTSLVILGVLATALFFGDCMITPAISVLSAIEGLATVEQGFDSWVVPLSIGILVGLFWMQAIGTAKVGRLFGPIMLVYFVTLAGLGIAKILDRPGHPVGDQPDVGGAVRDGRRHARVPGAGFGRAVRDGRGGALCRHGAFRAETDRVGVVLADLSRR